MENNLKLSTSWHEGGTLPFLDVLVSYLRWSDRHLAASFSWWAPCPRPRWARSGSCSLRSRCSGTSASFSWPQGPVHWGRCQPPWLVRSHVLKKPCLVSIKSKTLSHTTSLNSLLIDWLFWLVHVSDEPCLVPRPELHHDVARVQGHRGHLAQVGGPRASLRVHHGHCLVSTHSGIHYKSVYFFNSYYHALIKLESNKSHSCFEFQVSKLSHSIISLMSQTPKTLDRNSSLSHKQQINYNANCISYCITLLSWYWYSRSSRKNKVIWRMHCIF